MKKHFFDFMGTLFKTGICVVCCLSLIGLSSCSDDEDDMPTTELVSSTIPSAGWSGSTTNGICTYRSNNYEDDDLSGYYAFAFENGKCIDAVYNVVCENESIAKLLSQKLNNGEWFDDDEEDYDMSMLRNEQILIQAQINHFSKAVKSVTKATRSTDVMGITCTQEGKVVYFKVEAVKGLGGEEVKYVMKAWDTGLDINDLPFEEPIKGKWDENTGKYTCNNVYAIRNCNVEVETAFDSEDILTKYFITFTLPNETWAEMIEASLEGQAAGYLELFGVELEIVRNGNVVTADEVNIKDIGNTKENVRKMIVVMDILYAQPIGTAIF